MKWLGLLAMSVFLISCGSSNSGSGNEGPGGGDVTAQSVADIAGEVYASVRAAPRLFPEVVLADLEKAIQRARIIIKDRTYANGVETDASNNGSDLIEINRARWRLITDPDRRVSLVFHELLGLMGLEKNTYWISNRLLSVKNRFAAEATYKCTAGTRECRVTMGYDRTIGAFVLEDKSCQDFPTYPITIFRRVSSSEYSIMGSNCSEDTEDPTEPVTPGGGSSGGSNGVKSCSATTMPGEFANKWHTLTFRDGYEFFFSGKDVSQLHCELPESNVNTGIGFESSSVNGDGSVTYMQPRFRYAGQWLRLAQLGSDMYQTAVGFCKLAGQDNIREQFIANVSTSPQEKFVELDKQGKFVTTWPGGGTYKIINGLTCGYNN